MNVSEGPDAFADLLSSFVNSPLEEKQLLLETVNPIERIELLVDWIQRDLGKATVDRELQRQIQTSIDRRERENYLREQLRVIQDELGESNPGDREADTYRERVEALPLTDDYKQQLRREVNRLGQLSPSSSDYAVLRGHLDTVLQVPWTQKTEDRLDLQKAEGSLGGAWVPAPQVDQLRRRIAVEETFLDKLRLERARLEIESLPHLR